MRVHRLRFQMKRLLWIRQEHRFIIEEALKDDPRPLHVAFLGPLTDMASALLLEPSIAERSVRVVWIGGGDWPVGWI